MFFASWNSFQRSGYYFVMLLVIIGVKERLEVLDVVCARSLKSDLFFANNIGVEQALRGHNNRRSAVFLAR